MIMLFGNMVICLKVVVIIVKNIDQVVLTYLQSSLLYYVGMQVDYSSYHSYVYDSNMLFGRYY